jgi:hypothetical protein
MRGTIAKISDSVLSLVVPRATASAKYCLACQTYQVCPILYPPGSSGGGHFTTCLNQQQGWIQLGCVQGCP